MHISCTVMKRCWLRWCASRVSASNAQERIRSETMRSLSNCVVIYDPSHNKLLLLGSTVQLLHGKLEVPSEFIMPLLFFFQMDQERTPQA